MNLNGEFSPEEKQAGRDTYNATMKNVISNGSNTKIKHHMCVTLSYAGVCHVASAALNLMDKRVMGEDKIFSEKDALETAKRWVEDEFIIMMRDHKKHYIKNK